ncbi:hypothetical protein [uncultured Corynebacterium sp.]|uniref:hypothetical protein n=1 Tax=uncultured Corynebacterium sp. TaxID=159447 RepID=UPI0025CD0692|nr:hypothetical protein [uncultured Corynebacterium sp.]
MRNKIVIVISALITTLVVFNLIRITIGIYTGDYPVQQRSLVLMLNVGQAVSAGL